MDHERGTATLEWQSRKHLEDHFDQHGHGVGTSTAEQYDASARALLVHPNSIDFRYVDRTTDLTRVGVYDPQSGLFTVLSDDDRWIINHLRVSQSYIYGLRRFRG